MAEIIRPNENPNNQNGKKKSIGKKIFQFGCLPLIGLFILLMIISIAFETSDENKLTDENSNVIKKDSIQIVQEQKEKAIQDSLNVIKQNEIEKLLATFNKKTDDFTGTTFYRDKRAPNSNKNNFIFPYLVYEQETYFLRMRFQYTANNWLFIQKVLIKTDDNDYTISGNFERDNHSEIWEWYDISPNIHQINMLRDIALSDVAKVRYEGRQYHKDRTITDKEKDIIKKTLEIFDNLENTAVIK